MIQRKGLFNFLGFKIEGLSRKKYRKGEEEFVFRANTQLFKKKSCDLITRIYNNSRVIEDRVEPIIMSIHPKYAGLIMRRRKTVEIRRKFSKKLVGSKLFIYATRPEQ